MSPLLPSAWATCSNLASVPVVWPCFTGFTPLICEMGMRPTPCNRVAMGIQVVRALEVMVLACGAALFHSDLVLSLFPIV